MIFTKLDHLVGFPSIHIDTYILSLYHTKHPKTVLISTCANLFFLAIIKLYPFISQHERKLSKPLVYESHLPNTKLKAADVLMVNIYNIVFSITYFKQKRLFT